MNENRRWWAAPKNEVHGKVLQYVQQVEQDQFDNFNRFVQLAALYDPNGCAYTDGNKPTGIISENVIASNVDTVTAIVAGYDLRARIMTDDGDWEAQRMARQQELYAEGLEKTFDTAQLAELAFGQGPGIRGTGLLYIDACDGKVVVEHVLADDIVVPDIECRNGRAPRQAHRRKLVDRDELKAQFPKFEVEIDKAQGDGAGRWTMWANYRPLQENEVVLIHSHFLGIGTKDQPGYVPGRECITIDGCTLLDKEWTDDVLPYPNIVWSKRPHSFYGISLAERIMGHQQVLNNSNYQIDKLVNLNALPTTYVSMADAKMAATVQRPGTVIPIKGQTPVTVTAPAISPEVYKRVADVKTSASEESGVNRMIQHGTKPAGLDSGAALREYKDSTTQRFALQEKAYERFRRDIVLHLFRACKKLGSKAPVVTHRTRFGNKKIVWSKVDLKAVKTQINMASTLPRTPAGRTQFVLELAQGGIISQDSAKRLLQHPDIERELSLYTAALENLEHCFDAIADGEIVMPEPFQNLKMAVWRGQQTYLKWSDQGAPEEVLEALRQFVVQAADMSEPKEMPMAPGVAANSNAMDPSLMAPSGDPTGGMGGAPAVPMNGNMPVEAAPQAALAAQAMNLRAV